MLQKLRYSRPSHTTVVAYLSLFLALGGGAAYAANTIGSNDVIDNTLQSADLRDNAGVKSVDVINDDLVGGGLRGQDIIESQLGKVPDADKLDGIDSNAFVKSDTYRNQSTVNGGRELTDGTFSIAASCLPGDRLLAGGPAAVDATTDLLESFPTDTSTWSARVQKNGGSDTFSVVVLCANQ